MSGANAAAMIADLDAALAENGQPIRLVRPGSPAFGVDCRALVRGYNPADIVPGSGITQMDRQIVLSPTDLAAAGWPGLPPRTGLDPLVPREGDRVVTQGAAMTVSAAGPIYVGDILVRIELTARGG